MFRRVLVYLMLVLVAAGWNPRRPTTAFAEPLKRIKVINDRAPDCSSLRSIVESITRDCKTDDERAIAIYNFCRYDHYHHAYPSEPKGVSALKFINVYGWGLCGGQHTVQAALWEAAGYKWRYRGWRNPGHTTVEVYYGDRWHYLDTFLKFYAWTSAPQFPGGRTIASQEDIRANPSLVTDAFILDGSRKVCYHSNNRFDYVGDRVNWTAPAFLVCGDTLGGVVQGVNSSHDSGSPRGWGGIRFDDPDYSTDVNLAPGYSLDLTWNKVDDGFYFRGHDAGAYHSCGDKDYRNCPAIGPLLEPYRELDAQRTWSNGTLTFNPDLRSPAATASFIDANNVTFRGGAAVPSDPMQPAELSVEMSSPYVVARASGTIRCDACQTSVSTDGVQWNPCSLDSLTDAVRGEYRYFVKVTFTKPLTAMTLTSLVQHNQEALPYLAPGKNHVTIAAANPESLGGNRLVVTYAYCLGSRDKTPTELFDRDAEIARGHYATWNATPVVVRKTITEFPAKIDIQVPTPKGKQPVYPRMLFLRREVLAPGQSPSAVPTPPISPTVGDDEYLANVPVPWLIGTGPPRTTDDRPVHEESYSPSRVSYVSKRGEVFEHQFVKWLKDSSDAWILLADFQPDGLPSLRELASAKLRVYVEEAHDKASMQAGVAGLNQPFQVGKPYDFSKLGAVVGTTIVQRGNGPGAAFVPARCSEIDVTRLVRGWIRGEPNHGMALRIIPNRGVDDGWTVRFTPVKEHPVELVISTYATP